METATAVRDIIAEQAFVSIEEVALETPLRGLSLDSLDAVEIGINIENEFGVSIPSNEIMHWKTVQDVVSYVESKVKV